MPYLSELTGALKVKARLRGHLARKYTTRLAQRVLPQAKSPTDRAIFKPSWLT